MNKETENAIDLVRDGDHLYYLAAYGFAKEWSQLQMKPFTSETLKEVYYQKHPEPAEPRVWGAVIRELSREGLILHNGFTKYKNPVGHSKPCQVWISRKYSETQRTNRLTNSKTQLDLFNEKTNHTTK